MSHDLFDSNVQQSKAAFNEIANYLAKLPKPGAGGVVRQVDDKTLDTLKGLGYIE